MNTQNMRAELEKRYSKQFVSKLKDNQVIAVYKRLQAEPKKKN